METTVETHDEVKELSRAGYTIYAIKGDEDWRDAMFSSLSQGEGRFGWSYVPTADLHLLKSRIAAGVASDN
jgi:hypothetical protein